jgi:hypothetical protein
LNIDLLAEQSSNAATQQIETLPHGLTGNNDPHGEAQTDRLWPYVIAATINRCSYSRRKNLWIGDRGRWDWAEHVGVLV